MAYEYTDPRREGERDAQPDVEVFHRVWTLERGFYYAFGFPGCLWDSDPTGPFTTYQAALDDARRHGDCHEDYAPEQEEPKK
ncbi:MAG: hypothetical protein V3S55_07690 [Nitrospiraceae bacterium]